jgi:hypothetical protein
MALRANSPAKQGSPQKTLTVLARSGNLLIARAAFAKAVELYPDQAIDLRDRSRVIARYAGRKD